MPKKKPDGAPLGADEWLNRLAMPLVAPVARAQILDALRLAEGNRERAAELLGVSLRALYRLLSQLGLHEAAREQASRLGHRDWSPGSPKSQVTQIVTVVRSQ